MPDDLAARILGESPATGRFSEGGGLAVVAGFKGESGDANVTRLYLTPDCSTAYVEFPTNAALDPEGVEIGTERSIFPGTAYWLPKNQDLTCWFSAPLSAKKLDATLLASTAQPPVSVNGAAPGTERFIGEAIAVGSTLWGAAGALGLQDDIQNAAGAAVQGIGNTVKGWFGW